MVEGAARLLRPSHVYFFTVEQASKVGADEREYWFVNSTKPGFRPAGQKRWYADTTREPIRDETIRFGLLEIGAVGRAPGKATTSSGSKVRHQDEAAAADLGLKIDAAKTLPDIILVNVGESGDDTALVFVEVVASDGAMTESSSAGSARIRGWRRVSG